MATYYWVGGTGTWDASSTANWALTSGGLPGVAAPNSTDIVIFDSASGTGTCTTASGSACATATLNTSTLGLTLGANHSMSGTFTLTLGSLSLGSNTLTCNIFSSSNTNTRSIDFGTGNITITGNAATVWTTANITNLTISGTPVINATYSGAIGTRTINTGALLETQAISVNVTAGGDIIATSSSGYSFKNLIFSNTFTGFLSMTTSKVIYGNLTISTAMTVSAGTGTLTFAATSGTQQVTTAGKTFDNPITQNSPSATVQLQDNLTMGSTRTFTLTAGTLDLSSGNRTLSTGLFSSSNSNVRSILFGTGNITVTGNAATIFNGGTSTSTGITITGTPTVNLTYSGSTGTRTINGGSRSVLTETQTFSFNVSAGSDTVVLTNANAFRSLDFTGFAGTLTNNAVTLYGSLNIASGMTLTASANAITFAATSGTQQITTNSKTLDFPLIFNGIGGTFAFQDALTQGSTRAFTITNGTVQLKNNVTTTVGAFATSGANQKFLQSTTLGSQATLSQASGTIDASYLTIRDINATGGATWNAFVNQQNIDAGNNDGWDFGISPIVGSYEYTYQLRSFTQPRRF
jgi:hypothetical protein